MDPKNWWQSRTIWLGVFVAIAGVLSTATRPDGTPLLPPDVVQWLLVASGIAGILLRIDTTEPLKPLT